MNEWVGGDRLCTPNETVGRSVASLGARTYPAQLRRAGPRGRTGRKGSGVRPKRKGEDEVLSGGPPIAVKTVRGSETHTAMSQVFEQTGKQHEDLYENIVVAFHCSIAYLFRFRR